MRKVLFQPTTGPGVPSKYKIVAVSTCVEVVLSAVELYTVYSDSFQADANEEAEMIIRAIMQVAENYCNIH